MKFLMLVCTDPEGEEYSPEGDTIEEWVAEGQRRGLRSEGDRLRPPEEAKAIRRRSGGVSVTDGPYVESREVIGGYFVVEAADYDAAAKMVEDCPHLDFGSIEIRRIEVMQQ